MKGDRSRPLAPGSSAVHSPQDPTHWLAGLNGDSSRRRVSPGFGRWRADRWMVRWGLLRRSGPMMQPGVTEGPDRQLPGQLDEVWRKQPSVSHRGLAGRGDPTRCVEESPERHEVAIGVQPCLEGVYEAGGRRGERGEAGVAGRIAASRRVGVSLGRSGRGRVRRGGSRRCDAWTSQVGQCRRDACAGVCDDGWCLCRRAVCDHLDQADQSQGSEGIEGCQR
jgi:hypothetical protein